MKEEFANYNKNTETQTSDSSANCVLHQVNSITGCFTHLMLLVEYRTKVGPRDLDKEEVGMMAKAPTSMARARRKRGVPKPVALVAETSKQTVVETQLPHRTKLEARVLKQQWLQPSSSLLSLPLFYQPVTYKHMPSLSLVMVLPTL